MGFIVMVQTAPTDRGTITNSRSKQATYRINGPLEGRQTCVNKTKKQTGEQDQSPARRFKKTHLTPMHKGDAFGDLQRISHRISSLGLIP
jgi:hypothetical protein